MNQYILKSILNLINPSILKLIEGYMAPKEFEKKEFGEVFTPLFLIEEMLGTLPDRVWQNKDLKWYDPSSGIGLFAIIIYYKLFSSLKHIIKDDKERSKWIIEKMLYLNELNPANVLKTKQIFELIDPDAQVNIRCSDFLQGTNKDINNIKKKDLKKDLELEKYNIIVGNPPYNKSRLNGTFDSSLYPQFVVKSLTMLSDDGMLLFITPSRWFSGGNGLNNFKDYMLKRNDIVLIKHYDNSKTIWPTVDIAGGINYILIVLNQNNQNNNNITNNNGLTHFIDAATGITTDINLNTYDILVQNVDAYSMIDKVLKEKEKKKGISDIYLSTKYFGINTNSEHFHKEPENDNDKEPENDNGKEPDKVPESDLSGSLTKCYVSKKKGSIKYVASSCIKNPYNFWKVFSLQACGKINDGFKTLIIGTPDEIASQTFFTFKVNSMLEAESLKSYLESNYANFMLKLRKIDHHINKNTLKWILLPPLNQIWTNDSINTFFGLTKREIDIIN